MTFSVAPDPLLEERLAGSERPVLSRMPSAGLLTAS
jgi:hypothetical protein